MMKKLTNLYFKNVKILDGFWKWRYDINRNVSVRAVYNRFEETGRFDALRFNYREGKEFPHVFYDSDVSKWIDAVGYLIMNDGGYEKEQEIIDALVVDMAKNQLPDGYIQGTTGAGDAFCAGALFGIYQGKTDKEILEFASAAAVAALSSADATSGLRTEKEIKELCNGLERRKICL